MNTQLTFGIDMQLSVKSRRLANTLFRWENLLQTRFHKNVEAQTVMFFLHVAAQEEPVDITSLGRALALSKAACSRNYYRLSGGLRDGNEGLALIEAQDDPRDYRRKLLVLTKKGVGVAQELTDFIAEQVERINQNANQK